MVRTVELSGRGEKLLGTNELGGSEEVLKVTGEEMKAEGRQVKATPLGWRLEV